MRGDIGLECHVSYYTIFRQFDDIVISKFTSWNYFLLSCPGMCPLSTFCGMTENEIIYELTHISVTYSIHKINCNTVGKKKDIYREREREREREIEKVKVRKNFPPCKEVLITWKSKVRYWKWHTIYDHFNVTDKQSLSQWPVLLICLLAVKTITHVNTLVSS